MPDTFSHDPNDFAHLRLGMDAIVEQVDALDHRYSVIEDRLDRVIQLLDVSVAHTRLLLDDAGICAECGGLLDECATADWADGIDPTAPGH